ncbi:MAG: hypothetical protein DRI34_04960 [Deltaproteobacteria bacterium]|nr:MAG: hypothetical protein DRI34_04960 [Deltaproteobacteria bacterium]
MHVKKTLAGLWGVLFTLVVVLPACGGDGESAAQFKATVKDRMSRTPMGGITVTAVDNSTGQPLAGFEEVSEPDGSITFEGLPGEKVGFLCHEVPGEHVDTYQFNISTTAQDEELWLVDLGTYQMAPALGGVTLDTSKGVVAGSIYWVNAQGEEEPIGCAQVVDEPATGAVRYFGGNELPVKPTADDPVNGRDSTHPNNGLFLIANMEPGPVTMKIVINGEEKGSVDVVTFGAENTLLISNIYADDALTANPTPADCQ